MSDRVTITMAKGIAEVRLNRPDKLNALDHEMFEALVEAGRSLAGDGSLRAVVLSAEGRAFCAGLDFQSFQSMAGDDGRVLSELVRPTVAPANFAQSTAWVWHVLPVPVIAAVHGVAFGGGLQVALGADIRIVAPDARLSVREIHWGLIPDMAGPQLLRRLVRADVAKELSFTGREVDGHEAVALGLATRVADDPRAAALEMAREIASRSPHAVRSAKRLLDQVDELSPAAGLALEESSQRALIGSANQVEAVRANFEKRPPVFEDPA